MSPTGAPALPRTVSERKIVFLLAAVQFVNILDFMIVMPLGPDFATALAIPTSRLGLVAGSYTASAAVAGLLGALFLDRFDRRKALAVAMLGLVAGTASAAFASTLGGLVGARVLAGAFGGPATSIAYAILTDAIPAERRGRAMGAVMGAFSAASVLGVPAGLELATIGGWQAPFLAVALLGLLVGGAVFLALPPLKGHLAQAENVDASESPGLRPALLADGKVRLSFLGTLVTFVSTFALVPNLATFIQYNLGYPRERLSLLYLVGGMVSFGAMRLAGRLVDSRGPLPVVWFGSLTFALLISGGFIPERTPIPVMVIFVGFMLANSARTVAYNTLASKIPAPAVRARFMSGQSAVQHVAAALGAFLSSLLLRERPDHGLSGMPAVAVLSLVLVLTLPFIVRAILRRLPPAGS